MGKSSRQVLRTERIRHIFKEQRKTRLCDLILAHLVVYLSMAPKSNSVYRAYGAAVKDVRKKPAYQVPLHIRNAPTGLMKDLNYGKGYEYSHDMPYSLSHHSFFPEELGERQYYRPGVSGREKDTALRLKELRKKIAKMRKEEDGEAG